VTDIAAVLWDLDGTLVDTEPVWMAGEHELAARHDAIWTEQDGLALVGNSLIDSALYIRERIGSGMAPEDIVDFLVQRVAASLAHDIPWRRGAREMVEAFDELGVPQALVTMSYAPIAAPVAARLPLKAVVSGEQVAHGKPHPEPYLRAAELLGVDAADCLAVEDSGTGAASANAAGCHVVVVPNFVNVVAAPRRVQVPTLDGLGPEELIALATGGSLRR